MHVYIISLLKRGLYEVVFIGPNGPWILNTTVYLYNLYCCTVHLDINVYVHQLMHLFISPRKH